MIDSEGYAVYVHDTDSSSTTIYLLFQKSEGKTFLIGAWRSVRIGRFTGETGECTGEIYGERSGFALGSIFSFLSFLIPSGENGIYDLIPILSIGGIIFAILAIMFAINKNLRLKNPPVEEVKRTEGWFQQPQSGPAAAPQPPSPTETAQPEPQPKKCPKDSRLKRVFRAVFGRKLPKTEGEIWPELHPRKVPPKGPKPKMGRSVPIGPKYEK